LQDTELTSEQRKVLALAYFERLAKMPWSNYRFRLAGNKKYETDTKYTDRRNWYSGYKSYLDVLALDKENKKLDEEIKKLDEQWKKLDEQWKKLDEQWKKLDEQWKKLDKDIETLDRQIKLFKWLLETYQNYKK
jgi:chromosome segregation ATPase